MDNKELQSNVETSSDELEHWGIKGMQWGRRRYQNYDGSLTPAGRERYSDYDMEDAYNEGRRAEKAKRAERRKRLLKLGAAAAATALAIYGIKKYSDAKNLESSEKGKNAVNEALEQLKKERAAFKAEKAAVKQQNKVVKEQQKADESKNEPIKNMLKKMITKSKSEPDGYLPTYKQTEAYRREQTFKKASSAKSINGSMKQIQPFLWERNGGSAYKTSNKSGSGGIMNVLKNATKPKTTSGGMKSIQPTLWERKKRW